MPAPVIMADSLAKAYGGRHLFDEATFQVEEGEVVALVGPNGAGKSTLLRILAGHERPDSGVLKLRDGMVSQVFEQHPEVPKGRTVQEVVLAPLPVPSGLARERAELEARINDPTLYETPGYEAVLERYATLEQEIKRATSPKADIGSMPVFSALGFQEADLEQDASTLSGGQRTRLFLARVLGATREGDLLVLDEPTNHLDIDTIEWLEDWLARFVGTALVVAHDRRFLDEVATSVLDVSRGTITAYPGNYSDFVTLRDARLETERKEHLRALAEVRRGEQTIQQFRHQKRFDGQYASRMKQLDKFRAQLAKAPDPVLQELGFGLKFDGVDKSSNEMIHATGLTKAFDGQPVLSGTELELKKGDRIGLVGPNGAGKSTLIKLLTGQEKPDKGSIRAAPGVQGIVLSQGDAGLDPESTVKSEVHALRPTLLDEQIKALVGRFRFDPEVDLARKVRSLSGGERQRLALLKTVLKPSNLLILDEPTNHLDLESREVLAHALNTYPGTVLVVSHDRFLLDSVTNKTVVVWDGKAHVYPGTFSETREKHPRKGIQRVIARRRYVVKKKFADWDAGKKYLYREEHMLSDDEVQTNHALRNAVANGWLQRA